VVITKPDIDFEECVLFIFIMPDLIISNVHNSTFTSVKALLHVKIYVL
jgi:hypothetical protein